MFLTLILGNIYVNLYFETFLKGYLKILHCMSESIIKKKAKSNELSSKAYKIISIEIILILLF